MVVKNKKGVEFTLQTIAAFILILIVVIVIANYFVGNYSEGANSLFNIGNSSIESAKNYK